MDGSLQLASGRTLTYADFDEPDQPGATAVLWNHGGPGCRLEPAYVAAAAREAGLRMIGVDRPGYGGSDVDVGRSIADGARDLLAVADHLGIERFATVGVSTGGAYALAVAALAPDRVVVAVPTCAMTDMRNEEARATMSRPHAVAVWDAPDRDAAIAAAVASHGLDGSKIMESADPDTPPLPASDLAMLIGHPFGQAWMEAVPVMFAQGLDGYADDRLADGPGWVSFDVAAITAPVVVLHGAADIICDPVHARHTASIVPGAELRLVPDLGHFSIFDEVVPTLAGAVAHRRPDRGAAGRSRRRHGIGTMPPMTDEPDVVSVERIIPAPAADIFAILCDPARHHEIDGSGTVRDAKGAHQRLELGSRFGMSMKMGVPYSMVSTVVEYEPDRRIAWQTRGPTPIGQYVAGRIWRYELEPVEEGTLVRESWDIRQESPLTKPIVRHGADTTRRNMAATLQRIEDVLAPPSGEDG